MSDQIIFKKCERKEYSEFLDMVNTAFEYGAENEWFQKNMSHCTPYADYALDEEIQKHYIAVTDGKVIGAVGAYPMDLVITEDAPNGEKISLKSFGIGQVSCLKEYRGRSVMSKLLRIAIEDNIKDGALLAFLAGDRFRYGVHGFDFGGNYIRFTIIKRRFSKFADLSGLSVEGVTPSNIKILHELHRQNPVYSKRDGREWEKQLSRKKNQWLFGEKNDKKAYICVNEKKDILELQGDADAARSLILWYMETSSLDKINIAYPQIRYNSDAISDILWQTAMEVTHTPADLISICAPDKLLTLLTPIIIRQGYGDALNTLDQNGRALLVKTLFGFSGYPMPRELKKFQGIRPLIFWIPPIDNI